MTDKIVYFLRHGQAESNANHFFAGQADVPLTPRGVAQAKATAPLLAHIRFDKVFCSDLQRAKSTAALALPQCECEYVPDIREIDVGELTYQPVLECAKKYGERYLNARRNGDYSVFGGESRTQLDARTNSFLERVAALEDTPVVGAVCHGGVMRSAARLVLGDCKNLAMPDNCGICVFEYTDGKWRVRRWNATVEV